MKILHLCNKVPFPGRDGSSIAMESLIRLELNAGHRIDVIALNTNKHFVTNPKSFDSSITLKFFNINLAPSPFSFIYHCLNRTSYFASRFYKSEIASTIKKASENSDLIVVDSIYMSVYKKSWGDTPFIIRTHNVEHQIWERTLSSLNLSFKKLFIQWQTRKLKNWEINLIQGSHIWAITEEDSLNIKKIGAKSTEVFPCTFNHKNTWTFSGSSSNRVYHLGALDWEPNIVGMSWFVKAVIPKIPDAIEVTVYSKIWPDSIKRDQAISWNNSSTRDIPFQDHGIFIAPLLSGSGMRIKLLEAMSRGKAIVTTSIGAEGLLCTNKTHLCIADTAEEFAIAISELYNNSNFRDQMGISAREHAVRNFSDELFIKKMKDIEVRS